MVDSRTWADVRPSAELARRYRELGYWRDQTPATDLRRWAAETPDATAVTAHVAGVGVRRMTYRQYAGQVDRVTGALAGMGIGAGDVVTVQLPNWWQFNALVLACARLGAIVAPVIMTVRARELELMMRRLEPVAYVTTQAWDGYEHSTALASIADRLPSVRHRMIIGGRAASGEIDLDRRMEETDPAALEENYSAEDPDQVSIVVFTSGTTGAPKAVLHSFNTFYAGNKFMASASGLSSDDVLYVPHALGHVLAQHFANTIPLYLGAEAVIADTWDPEDATRLLAQHRVTFAIGAPTYVEAIAQTARLRNQKLRRLRQVFATATVIPASLVSTVRDDLGITLQTLWGMTEVGPATITSAELDPPDWAAHSIGKPFGGVETDLRSDTEVSAHNPGRLFVRGPLTCLATMPRDGGQLAVLADNDGWYDTGDLAVPDGRGGLRLAGRAVDRIGGALMIPASDVEDALREHPHIDDVALVGYGPGNELGCAVMVTSKPLTLHEVRAYLNAKQMTDWYQPTRIETVRQLPRNLIGKVDKLQLRTLLISPEAQEDR